MNDQTALLLIVATAAFLLGMRQARAAQAAQAAQQEADPMAWLLNYSGT
jgi:hypothetical protein